MAYFSDGTAGMLFDDQCSKCKYYSGSCPIALVQITYNYDAVNNEIATKILDTLVKDNGDCMMWKTFKQDLEIDPNQLELF